MKLLMKGYGLKAFEKEVNSEEEAVNIFEEMRDEYLDGRSSNEIYQVILMDDGSMKNISHNGRITPMEDYCKEWISSRCEFAEELVKLGYKGPFKDKAKMKESRVKPGNNGLEELDQVVLNYFAEALGDPIVKNTGSDPKSFTYTVEQHQLEKTYEVSLDGEYYDDVWIKLEKWDIGAQTSYVIAAGCEEYYWSGMSAEELQIDLEDCFANVALPNRHLHESKKITESHAQSGCPVCGEKIWSDEGVADVVIDGKKVKVHEYHCTRESIEKRQAYCDRFWATHDSTGYNYYVSMKQFHPPICQLRDYNDEEEDDDE